MQSELYMTGIRWCRDPQNYRARYFHSRKIKRFLKSYQNRDGRRKIWFQEFSEIISMHMSLESKIFFVLHVWGCIEEIRQSAWKHESKRTKDSEILEAEVCCSTVSRTNKTKQQKPLDMTFSDVRKWADYHLHCQRLDDHHGAWHTAVSQEMHVDAEWTFLLHTPSSPKPNLPILEFK